MKGLPDRFTPRQVARLAGLAVAVVLVVVALGVVPPWLAATVSPRGWRRIAIGFLWAVLTLQVAGLLGGLVGAVASVVLLRRARRDGRPRAGAMCGLVLCLSCLIGLALVEAGAAAWRAWAHRYPALPTKFADDGPGRPSSPAGRDLHLLVVGESSALGIPYEQWLSVGSIVAWQLERVFPGEVSVEYRARSGANLEPMHQGMADIDRRPDAVLIYSGHNEFQAIFPWERDVAYYRDAPPVVAVTTGLERLGRLSNFGRLVLDAIDRRRVALRRRPG